MSTKTLYRSLLVPTDFSDNAWQAFMHAVSLLEGEPAEIVVVHVIDSSFVDQIVELGVSDHEQVLKGLRENAAEKMQHYADQATDSTKIDTLVCVGEPFLEIIQKTEDFDVDAVVMSKLGQRAEAESLLFGSTAEKVTRGSKKPVVVLPNLN